MGQELELPDGRILEYPIEATREQIEQHAVQWAIDNPLPVVTPVPEPVVEPKPPEYRDFFEGTASALGQGVSGVGDAFRDVATPFRSEETYQQIKAEMEKERALAAQEKRPISFQALRDIYGEQGVGEALIRFPQFASEAAAGSVPYMAVPLAAGLAASNLIPPIPLPFFVAGKAVIGTTAFIAAGALQFFGMNIGRQIEEGAETKEDLDVGRAAIMAPLQAAADVLLFRLFGIFGKGRGSAAAEKEARSVVSSLVRGTGKGIALEVPTEVGQQMAERWQAGLPLLSDEALSEYLEAGAAAFVVGGGIGGVTNVYQNKKAKQNLLAAAEAANKKQQEREQAATDAMAPDPDAPLLLTDQTREGQFTDRTPEQEVEALIDESINQGAPTGLGEDIGSGAPIGPFSVSTQPNGGFAVVNGVGEVRTASFATLDEAQRAADLLTEAVPVAIETAEVEFTEQAARRALEENKIEETEATLEAAKETVTPLGRFLRDELPSEVSKRIDTFRLGRTALQPGAVVENDGEYTLEEISTVGKAGNKLLTDLQASRKPLTQDPDLNATINDIKGLAVQKNIKYDDSAFQTFALRTTGRAKVQNMSQVMRNGLFDQLNALPDFKNETSIPVIKYPNFTVRDVANVAKAIRETSVVSVRRRSKEELAKLSTRERKLIREQEKKAQKARKSRQKIDDNLIIDALGMDREATPKFRQKEIAADVRQELIRRGILDQDGRRRQVSKFRPQLERTPAPDVKRQELLQRLEPLRKAINERFKARKEAFPELEGVRLKANNVIDDIATGEIDPLAEGVFRYEGEAGQFVKTIRLALDAVTDPSKSDKENIEALSEVLDHEFIHAAFDAGVVTDQEKVALEKFVKTAKRPGTDQTYYEEQKDDPNLEGTPDEIVVEEAVAEAFRDYAAGRRVFPPKTRNIFRKIMEFFKLLRQSAADVNILTGNEIFENLNQGVSTAAQAAQPRTSTTRMSKPADLANAEGSVERLPDFPPEQKFSRKRSRKKPAPVGENPFPAPLEEDIEARLRRKAKRTDVAGSEVSTGPRNERKQIIDDNGKVVAVVGQMTFDDWINQTEGRISDAEIDSARQWYPEAAKSYQKYFGKDWPNFLAAWLMANQQASPSTAAMNAVRSREQALTQASQAPVSVDVKAGLAADRLFDFWMAMEAGGELPSGGAQKLYDFIDSGLLRETRSWMGNDVRGGAPAVADVHSLRDTGFVDKTYQKFLRENYGVRVETDTSGSPGENQYERSGDFMRALSDYLNDINYKGGGWTPYQVQSVGWMATTKFLGKPGQTAEESILFNIRNLPFEVAFGEGSPYSETFVDYYQLPAIGQKEVTGIAAEAATDFAREVTGVAEINRYVSTGGWLDDSLNPNMVEQVVASPEAMMDMANIIGYLVEQTGMFPYRIVPTETSKSKAALKIRPSDVSKDLLNNDTNMAILWDKIRNAELAGTKKAEKQLAKERKAGKEDARLPDADNIITGYTGTIDENGNAAMLILFDTKKAGLLSRLEPDGDVATAISRISEEMGIDLEGETAFYEGDFVENDWTEDKTGGVYLQRIDQRYGPAVTERVKNFKRGQLEPLLEDSITSARLKYGNRQRFSRRRTEPADERTVRDSGSLSRSERQLQAQDRSGATAQEEVRVEGLPASYDIPGTGPVPTEPFAPARQAARDYGQTVGRSVPELAGNYVYGPVDGEQATRIAQAYEDMPNTPEDSFTQAAYEALAEEVMTQYDFIKDTGLEVEFYPSDVDPYAASPREMIEDVKQNNHMYVFPTDAGFGTDGVTAEEVADNPMLRLTDEFISGRRARVNDIFRTVHDYFGHVKEGFGFRAAGEEAAYASHAVMFSPLARAALASETRGQNSWVNFGPAAKQNENASAADTVYADQKVGILPEFVINEGIENLVEPVNLQELQDETNFNTQDSFVPDQRFSRKYPQDPRNAAPNRFVKRARADGTRSDNWGKVKTRDGEFLNVRMASGQNYDNGGGYGQVHSALHDKHFRAIPDLPFTTSDAAIGAALDAYTEARVSGVGTSAFKITEGRRGGGQEMVWKPEGSATSVKIVFDRVTDSKSGQTFFAVTTAYPDSVVLRQENLRKEAEKYTRANALGENFAATSDVAQETTLTFKTKKPSGRPVLTLNKAAKQRFSRGRNVENETAEVQEAIRRTQAVNLDETAGQSFLSAIFGEYKDSTFFSNNWEKVRANFRANFVNSIEGISILSEEAAKVTGQLYADASAFKAALMAGQYAQVVKRAWTTGVPVYDEKGYARVESEVDGQPVKGLLEIFSSIIDQGLTPQFGLYASAKRAERIGAKSGLTETDIAAGLSLAQKYPEFEAVFDEYQVWNSYLVKFMVDTGLITAEMGQTWIETADYTPYYRQEQQGTEAGEMSFFYPGDPTLGPFAEGRAPLQGEASVQIPLDGKRVDKKLLGAGRAFQITVDGVNQPEEYDSYEIGVASVKARQQSNPDADIKLYSAPRRIDDFLDNLSRNTATAIQGGMKNIAAQRVIRDSLTMGVASEVQPDKDGKKPRNTVQIRVDGKDRYFVIVDPFLYTAMVTLGQNQDPIIQSKAIGYASIPARLLRELVTRDPAFMARNMMRDTLSAWVTSGRNYIPVIDSAKGVIDVLKGSDSSEALQNAGVFGGYDFAGTPKDMAKYIRSRSKRDHPSGVMEKAASPFKKLWDATTFATNVSEAATRVAVYQNVLKATGNEAQAVFEALEVLNFNRRGASPFIRAALPLIPFLNARIQGLDVLYRSSVNKEVANPNATKKAFLAKAALIIGVSSLYQMMIREEDCWKNANQMTRDLHWFIPIPGGPCLKIPTPFEVGFLFKTIPERIQSYALGDDTGKDLKDSVYRNITGTFAVAPPQAIVPIMETVTNYSLFTGKEVVPTYMQGLDPDYQRFQTTSSFAIALGEELNMSPIKIDHWIKGYTGTLGSYALSVGSNMINRFQPSDQPMPPNKEWYNLPMVRSFFQDPDGRGTVTQFYELNEMVKQAVNTLSKAVSEGDVKKITSISKDRANLLALEETMKSIRQSLKEVRQIKNIVMKSQLPPDEKRKRLALIRQQEIALTASVPRLKQLASQ